MKLYQYSLSFGVAILILLQCLSVFADEYATTESGQRVLLKQDGTWEAANADQSVGERKHGDLEHAEKTIRSKCAAEWPADFAMRAYCMRQQREAVQKLLRGKPQDISRSDFKLVRVKCASEWPADFAMRVYCQRQQFSAIRELREKKR